jgi:LacI family transcriptional regulator
MKRVSIKDIADELKLSKTTVSWILNDKAIENNISQKTIDKVLAAAKKMDYQPNYIAKSLSLGKSNTIGLIVPRITDTFFSQIAETLEQKAAKRGYTVFYGSSEEKKEKEKKLIDTFIGKQVDGLIIASSLYNHDDINQLIENKFPFVLIDRYYNDLDTSYVVVDDETGAYNLVANLLRKGKDRIGLILPSPHLSPIILRRIGYEKAHSDFNLPTNPSFIKEIDQDEIDVSVNKAVKELVLAKKVNAIFFATHYLAALGFKYLKELNVTIGKDVAICCFGDTPHLSLLDPPITAIPMPSSYIGEEALRILINNIESKTQFIERVILPVEINQRKSC